MDNADRLRSEMAALLPRLRRFCRSLAGSVDAADDLAQATIERALRSLDRFEPGTRLDRWLLRIAHNLWIDDRRAARNRFPHEDVAELPDPPAASLVDELEARSQGARVRAAIARLPDEQRSVVALVLVEGHSYAEAAEVIGVPVGTVMSRLSRARARLQADLGPREAYA